MADGIGLDCEFVELMAGSRMAAARVAVVDASGATLLDVHVTHDPATVRDYHTRFSGVTQADVDGSRGPTAALADVQATVLGLARGRVLVGHNLFADLRALSLTPADFAAAGCARLDDTAALDWGARDSTRLRALADELLGEAIQTGEHCPVDDALAALRLHALHAAGGGCAPPLARAAASIVRRGSADAVEAVERVERVEVEWCRANVRALLAARLVDAAPAAAAVGAPAAAAAGDRARGAGGCSPLAGETVCVRFAPGLSKAQRALVHELAAELHLDSNSAGLGDARCVAVTGPAAAAGAERERGGRRAGHRRGGGGGGARAGAQRRTGAQLEPQLEARALALYRAAQADGGIGRAAGRLSRDEVREAVAREAAGGGALPAELARLAEEQLLQP
ncbi:hypothetical protein KFE25_001587 [Diacronema lutheri]|uniref:Exonuclease domain-containing protein n=1 Tax=Diacronema lutheri TaxID=2081491 RepID=A0A8J5XLE1_DIALT|nr:hypothetical protein KFE25_001587 [Diacronema lutheri]